MISILSFTDKGKIIAENLNSKFKNSVLYHRSEIKEEGMENIWNKSDKIIFISATGIAVRYISKYIKHKSQDPAVIVIDDMGRFAISLLSGHLGGANEFAKEISSYISGSIPIITTASDSRGFESPDLFAQRNNYLILNPEKLTNISSKMVSGEKISIYSDNKIDWNYPNLFSIEDFNSIYEKDYENLIIISSKKINSDISFLQMVPKNLNLGIGCRRGVDLANILDLIKETFEKENYLIEGIKTIASIEIKSDEKAIIEIAEILKADLKFFSVEEISRIENRFKGSEFVKKSIGVSSVAEPCAYLLGNLIIGRIAKNGVTLAISREDK